MDSKREKCLFDFLQPQVYTDRNIKSSFKETETI